MNSEKIRRNAQRLTGVAATAASKLKHAADLLPVVDVDHSDDHRTTPRLEKERTRTLNNNPRNHDL